MTATALLIVLALTYLSMVIIDWLVAPMKRAPVIVVLLLVYFVWVIGWPLLVIR